MPVARAAIAPGGDFTDERARSRYEAGLEKFDAEDYRGALEDLDASIARERTTLALYAKAQTLNKLDRCGEAVPLYNEVLGSVPDESSAASAVKDALVVCAEKLALVTSEEPEPEPEPESESDPEPEPEEPPPRRAWYKDIPAPILLGVGVVGVGVGGAFLGAAARLDPENAADYGAFEVEREDQRDLRIRGGIILGIGGALVIGGAIRYALVARKIDAENASTARVMPTFGRRWGGVSVQGRF